eukprot:tig00020806_g14030.t1
MPPREDPHEASQAGALLSFGPPEAPLYSAAASAGAQARRGSAAERADFVQFDRKIDRLAYLVEGAASPPAAASEPEASSLAMARPPAGAGDAYGSPLLPAVQIGRASRSFTLVRARERDAEEEGARSASVKVPGEGKRRPSREASEVSAAVALAASLLSGAGAGRDRLAVIEPRAPSSWSPAPPLLAPVPVAPAFQKPSPDAEGSPLARARATAPRVGSFCLQPAESDRESPAPPASGARLAMAALKRRSLPLPPSASFCYSPDFTSIGTFPARRAEAAAATDLEAYASAGELGPELASAASAFECSEGEAGHARPLNVPGPLGHGQGQPPASGRHSTASSDEGDCEARHEHAPPASLSWMEHLAGRSSERVHREPRRRGGSQENQFFFEHAALRAGEAAVGSVSAGESRYYRLALPKGADRLLVRPAPPSSNYVQIKFLFAELERAQIRLKASSGDPDLFASFAHERPSRARPPARPLLCFDSPPIASRPLTAACAQEQHEFASARGGGGVLAIEVNDAHPAWAVRPGPLFLAVHGAEAAEYRLSVRACASPCLRLFHPLAGRAAKGRPAPPASASRPATPARPSSSASPETEVLGDEGRTATLAVSAADKFPSPGTAPWTQRAAVAVPGAGLPASAEVVVEPSHPRFRAGEPRPAPASPLLRLPPNYKRSLQAGSTSLSSRTAPPRSTSRPSSAAVRPTCSAAPPSDEFPLNFRFGEGMGSLSSAGVSGPGLAAALGALVSAPAAHAVPGPPPLLSGEPVAAAGREGSPVAGSGSPRLIQMGPGPICVRGRFASLTISVPSSGAASPWPAPGPRGAGALDVGRGAVAVPRGRELPPRGPPAGPPRPAPRARLLRRLLYRHAAAPSSIASLGGSPLFFGCSSPAPPTEACLDGAAADAVDPAAAPAAGPQPRPAPREGGGSPLGTASSSRPITPASNSLLDAVRRNASARRTSLMTASPAAAARPAASPARSGSLQLAMAMGASLEVPAPPAGAGRAGPGSFAALSTSAHSASPLRRPASNPLEEPRAAPAPPSPDAPAGPELEGTGAPCSARERWSKLKAATLTGRRGRAKEAAPDHIGAILQRLEARQARPPRPGPPARAPRGPRPADGSARPGEVGRGATRSCSGKRRIPGGGVTSSLLPVQRRLRARRLACSYQ